MTTASNEANPIRAEIEAAMHVLEELPFSQAFDLVHAAVQADKYVILHPSVQAWVSNWAPVISRKLGFK